MGTNSKQQINPHTGSLEIYIDVKTGPEVQALIDVNRKHRQRACSEKVQG